ncbi:hypothetical protein [Streptomyces sp. WG-D5]
MEAHPTDRAFVDTAQLRQFFQALLAADASLDDVLRDCAHRLSLAIGFDDGCGTLRAVSPSGERVVHGPTASALVRRLTTGETVWLDPGAGKLPTDGEAVLEQLVIAAKSAAARAGGCEGSTEHVHRAIGRAPVEERLAALRALGLSPTTPMRVLAVVGPPQHCSVLVGQVRRTDGQVRSARTERGVVVLASDHVRAADLDVPIGCQVGVSEAHPGRDAPRAAHEARTALRFTQPSVHDLRPYTPTESAALDFQDLGAYAVLPDEIRVATIGEIGDVQVLNTLAREEGEGIIRVLDAVSATDTYRAAARLTHMHHTSLLQRVHRAEQALGFELTISYGRNRLFLALLLRRLAQTADFV